MAENERESSVNSTAQQKRTSMAQKGKKINDKAKNAKKLLNWLKNGRSLAPLITFLSTAGIVLVVVILIIGFIGFFTTLPGLAVEKFLSTCKEVWRWIVGDTSIDVSSEQIDDLAQYIEDMGYDLEAYGFVSPGCVEKPSANSSSAGNGSSPQNNGIHVVIDNSRLKNLHSYVLANERTYAIQYYGGDGLLVRIFGKIWGIGDLIKAIDQRIRAFWVDNIEPGKTYGLIRMPSDSDFEVSIDREKNEMAITSKSGFLGMNRDQMKWDLTGWTSRYGKPIELSLALHLSTMAPDFVYNFCMNKNLNTVAEIGVHKVEYHVEYRYHTKKGINLDQQNVKDLYDDITGNLTSITALGNIIEGNVIIKNSIKGETKSRSLFMYPEVVNGVIKENDEYTAPLDVLYKTNIIKMCKVSDSVDSNRKYSV